MLNQIPRKRKRKLERKETIPLASFQALCREGSQRIQQCRTSQGTPQRSVWGDPQVCQRLPWTPCSWQSVSGCSQSWTPGAVPQTHPGWGSCWSQCWRGSPSHQSQWCRTLESRGSPWYCPSCCLLALWRWMVVGWQWQTFLLWCWIWRSVMSPFWGCWQIWEWHWKLVSQELPCEGKWRKVEVEAEED